MPRGWNYLVMLVASTLFGGFISMAGDYGAAIRGALLTLSLSAAIPVINIFLVEKNRDSVWKSALIGAGFGLIAGVIMFELQWSGNNGYMKSTFNQPPNVYLIAPPIYGLLLHAAYAHCRIKGVKEFTCFNLLLMALLVAGIIRLYPLYIPLPGAKDIAENLFFAINGGIAAAVPLGIGWFLIVRWLDPYCLLALPQNKNTLDVKMGAEILALVIVAFFSSMFIGLGYNDKTLINQSQHPEIMKSMKYALSVDDKIFEANGETSMEDTPYYKKNIEFRHKITVINDYSTLTVFQDTTKPLLNLTGTYRAILSPSGTQLAILSFKDDDRFNPAEKLEIYSLPEGKKTFTQTGQFGPKFCWTKDEKNLIIEQWKEWDRETLLKLNINSGKADKFADGQMPDLVLDSGKIAYSSNDKIYQQAPDGTQPDFLCELPLIKRYSGQYESFAVSPDAKIIAFSTRSKHPIIDCKFYYLLKDLKSGKQHLLMHGFNRLRPFTWLRPQDWDISMLKTNNHNEGEMKK